MFGNRGTRIASSLYRFLPMSRCHGIKRWLLRHIGGIAVGEGTKIWSTTRFSGQYIKIGRWCHFGEDNFIMGCEPGAGVEIGDNVTFGPNCYLTTGAHRLGDSSRRSGDGWQRPIVIGDGTAISVGAIIAAGTSIGRGCLLGPGVFASGKLPDNTMLMQPKPIKIKMSESGQF